MDRCQRNVEKLPPEIIQKILRFVPPVDLCNVVLTSTLLRTLASEPKFWSGITVRQDKIQQDGLRQLFSIDRYKKVRKIDLSKMTFTSEELLRNLNSIPSSVNELNLKDVSVRKVPAELLAGVASNLEKINLNGTFPTRAQYCALVKVCISSSTLIDVNLAYTNFIYEVPAKLLSTAVGNLHKVNLYDANLTTEQYIALLQGLYSLL